MKTLDHPNIVKLFDSRNERIEYREIQYSSMAATSSRQLWARLLQRKP